MWSVSLNSFGYQSLELVAMRMDFKLGRALSIMAEKDWPSPVLTDGLSLSRGCEVLTSLVCSCYMLAITLDLVLIFLVFNPRLHFPVSPLER